MFGYCQFLAYVFTRPSSFDLYLVSLYMMHTKSMDVGLVCGSLRLGLA